MAVSLNISRNTPREALRQLAAEGLVEQRLYKGAAVRAMTVDDVRDIFIARRAIQFRAVEESAYAPEDRFEALRDRIGEARRAAAEGDWAAAGTASLRFHQAVVALLGSPRLDAFFEVIMVQLSLALGDARDSADFQSRWVARNEAICEALCTGRREDATQSLRRFIDESERLVLDIVRFTWARRR